MSEVSLQERLEAATVELFDCATPFEVAEFLASKSIHGVPRAECDCPVTNLLKGEFPGLTVFADYVSLSVADDDNRTGSVRPPKPVQVFMEWFDGHEYPQLETPGSQCGEGDCVRCNPSAVDPITAEDYAKFFPERGDDGRPIDVD